MKIEKFKNNGIAFDFDKDMVNATDMIKNFPEKNMGNFLRNKQTKDFITELENDMLISTSTDSKAINVVKGGNPNMQGTWMHKLLAFKFAAWLSPKFELFVYKVFDKHAYSEIKKAKDEVRNAQLMESIAWNHLDAKDNYR